MAVQFNQPTERKNVILRKFAQDVLQAIQQNFETQKVWPNEVYPGYAQINDLRFKRGQWYSTGRGAKSFSISVQSKFGEESITLFFNDYLRFVDMGVGNGTTFEDVQAERKAHHAKRYIAVWNRKYGESHRPAIMMEMRHLQARMQQFFEDFYGREVHVVVSKTFEDLPDTNITL